MSASTSASSSCAPDATRVTRDNPEFGVNVRRKLHDCIHNVQMYNRLPFNELDTLVKDWCNDHRTLTTATNSARTTGPHDSSSSSSPSSPSATVAIRDTQADLRYLVDARKMWGDCITQIQKFWELNDEEVCGYLKPWLDDPIGVYFPARSDDSARTPGPHDPSSPSSSASSTSASVAARGNHGNSWRWKSNRSRPQSTKTGSTDRACTSSEWRVVRQPTVRGPHALSSSPSMSSSSALVTTETHVNSGRLDGASRLLRTAILELRREGLSNENVVDLVQGLLKEQQGNN